MYCIIIVIMVRFMYYAHSLYDFPRREDGQNFSEFFFSHIFYVKPSPHFCNLMTIKQDGWVLLLFIKLFQFQKKSQLNCGQAVHR